MVYSAEDFTHWRDYFFALRRESLEYRAKAVDSDSKNRLLTNLIEKYGEVQKRLVEINQELARRQSRLDDDLKAAAGIQQSLLPKTFPALKNYRIAWYFIPSHAIGGDIFNVFPLDDESMGLYMVDVSGHGVPAAMVTVSVSQIFQPHSSQIVLRTIDTPPYREIIPPREVLTALDMEYPVERFDKFFTIIYGVLHLPTGRMVYGNAGHVPALLARKDGRMEKLNVGGPIIGLEGMVPFEQEEKEMDPGDRVIFYTDGVTEYQNRENEFFGMERLVANIQKGADKPIDELLSTIYRNMMIFGENLPVQDDVSLLALERLG